MNYLNKIVLVICMALCLVGCDSGFVEKVKVSDVDTEGKTYEYLKPATVDLFDLLSDDLKNKFLAANSNEDLADYKLKALGKELTSLTVNDYYGNEINFNDYKDKKLVLEVVQENCLHCKNQAKENEENIKEVYPDVTFIKFFYLGNNDGVDSFYEKAGVERNPKDIIIPEDEELKGYVIDLGVQYSPTYLCYNNGIITWIDDGEISLEAFNEFAHIAFDEEPINLITNEGTSIFDSMRTVDSLKNDLSEESIKRLRAIDVDGYTESLTYDYLGRKVDWTRLTEGKEGVRNDVSDWSSYADKDVIVFFIELSGSKFDDYLILRAIKMQRNNYTNINCVVIIVENEVSSVELFESYGYSMYSDILSAEAAIPMDIASLDIYKFPTAIFIEKGTITGAYSSIVGEEEMTNAVPVFIGNKSIAHVETNNN